MAREEALRGAPPGAGVPAREVTPTVRPGPAVLARCRDSLHTWPRRCLMILTLLAGASSAIAVVAGEAPSERTMAAVSGPVQSVMSVLVAFLGVLLAHDSRHHRSRPTLVPSVLAALVIAALVGAFGAALCVGVTAVADSQAPHGRWEHVGTVAVGGVLVQVLAQLTGTGLGLLVRRRALACLLTVVLPLGLWLLLGALGDLRPAQAWLTPYASARNLLAGVMTPTRWLQWLAVLAIWGIALNLIGIHRAFGARTPSS